MIRIYIFLLCLLTMITPANAGLKQFKFQQDGFDRNYLLYSPSGISKNDAAPLVLVLHGGGGTSRQIMIGTRKRFNRLADEHGFYVVYPNAVEKVWDFGDGEISDALKNRRNDLQYFENVISHVKAKTNIDQGRVFVTGISRGGQASFYLTCKRPDLIRAFASVAMSLPEFMLDMCKSVSNKPVLLMNGTADPIVPFEGGQIRLGKTTRGAVMSTDATITLFAGKNGCSRSQRQSQIGAVTVLEWQSCRAPTLLYRINGGGHSWPGGRSRLPKQLIGPRNQDINAADEIWRFFSQF